VIVCIVIGMRCRSSGCEGIYKCSMRIGVRGELFNLSIWRYGVISEAMGILIILFEYA
jgi:hypothetical protein